MGSRGKILAAICLLAAIGLFFVYKRAAEDPPKYVTPESPLATLEPEAEPAPKPVEVDVEKAPIVVTAPKHPEIPWRRIFFRWTNVDEHYGKLAFVERTSGDVPRFIDTLSCEVVHFAAGRGICLQAERGVFTRYFAVGFDADFQKTFTLPLAGIPSRTRVSPDGRYGAVTVFLTGHSYASVDFTTQTLLLRLPEGEVLGDLEQFTVSRNGSVFRKEDFNFWGVTFAKDSQRFYCTLSTNRKHYLVEGDLRKKTTAVIGENVECPSLSADGTRIAYKKRLPGDRATWQLQVMDLASSKSTALSEKRNVDDQLEWLDNRQVLYALPAEEPGAAPRMDVWSAPADGSRKPARFLKGAYSPAVAR